MDAIESAVIVPAPEIVVQRASRRQILGDCRPLAACAEDIHQTVDDLALVDSPLVAAALGTRDQGPDHAPFSVRQIAGVA